MKISKCCNDEPKYSGESNEWYCLKCKEECIVVVDWQEFQNAKPVKHSADINVGDVLLLDDSRFFHYEEKTFERVVCDGYCGKDEFWGYEEATGQRRSWCDGDTFKIVGKSLTLNNEQIQ